jgi:hypothetical protein
MDGKNVLSEMDEQVQVLIYVNDVPAIVSVVVFVSVVVSVNVLVYVVVNADLNLSAVMTVMNIDADVVANNRIDKEMP